LLDIGQMIADTFPKSINVETHIPGDLWPVVSNSTQLHQIVLNLCINARDAMPAGGKLTLSARNETLVGATAGLPSGNYLLIEVADTGTGMTPEVLARIWDPFFTTKAEGQGTGLGLAMVRGIATHHGGTITVESSPGRGSVFRVLLPSANVGIAEAANPEALVASLPSLRNELVLVVDDDAEVRKLLTLSLSQWGYRTLQANDSWQAMEHYLAHSADISLVVFDLDLPGQDGLSLARRLQGLRPDLRVLFITGVDSLKNFQLPPLPAGAPLLKKPFARQSLRDEIQRALATPAFAL
jgi:CheY-like chemotaxis protein